MSSMEGSAGIGSGWLVFLSVLPLGRSRLIFFSHPERLMKFLMAGKENKSSLEVKPISQDMERDKKKYYYLGISHYP